MSTGSLFLEQTWFYHVLLGSHIIILLAGDIMLGVACVASIIFFYQEHHLKTKLMSSLTLRFPALGTLDRLSWQGILWGFLACTHSPIRCNFAVVHGPGENSGRLRFPILNNYA